MWDSRPGLSVGRSATFWNGPRRSRTDKSTLPVGAPQMEQASAVTINAPRRPRADILVTPLPDPVPSKLGELTKPAEFAMADLLRFQALKADHWLMRVTVESEVGGWEPLANDTPTNDRMIKERVAEIDQPVTELAMGYAGMIDWRGSKRLMACLQYFKLGYEQGLLCLRHLKEGPQPGKLEGFGGFLIVGACKNIWI